MEWSKAPVINQLWCMLTVIDVGMKTGQYKSEKKKKY
jgi:hypothetical protein